MAEIQFARGIVEPTTPEVKLTRSKDGQTGTATFYFKYPEILGNDVTENVTGMYMVDEEGEIVTREVKAKFINGQPHSLEGKLIMRSSDEWDRFMRFMERYAKEQGLELSKS